MGLPSTGRAGSLSPVTDDETRPADEPASAVPDPRDRRKGDRRSGTDRRRASDSADEERRRSDRRQGDRRNEPEVPEQYRAGKRSINEYPLESDELEFINAINAYKSRYDKPFPTWSEVLHVVKALGYRKATTGPRYKFGGDEDA